MEPEEGSFNHPSFQAFALKQLEALMAKNPDLPAHLAGKVQSILEGHVKTGVLHQRNKPVVSLQDALPMAGKAKQTLTLDDLVVPEQSIEATKDNFPVLVYNLPSKLDACEIGQYVKQACRRGVVISQVQIVAPGQAIIHFKTSADAEVCLASDGATLSGADGVWFLRAKIHGQATNFNSFDQHKSYSSDSGYSTRAMVTDDACPTGAIYGQDSRSNARQPLHLFSEAFRPDVQLEKMLTDEEVPTPERDPAQLLQRLLFEDTDGMAAKALQKQLGCDDETNNAGGDNTASVSCSSKVHRKGRTQWRPKFKERAL